MSEILDQIKAAIERQLRGPAFSNLLKSFGIDPRRYWLLMDLFHKLSTRDEMQGQFGLQSHALRVSAAWFFLFSAAPAAGGLILQARAWVVAGIVLAITAFTLIAVLLSEAANSLVNPEEALALSHQPITGATYTAAKLSHLLNIVFYTVVGWNLLPALATPFMKDGGWSYPLLDLLIAMTLGVLIALFCCSIYGLLMRVVPARRMKSASQFIQAIPIAIFTLFRFAPRGSSARVYRSLAVVAAPLQTVPWWLLAPAFGGIAIAVTTIGLRSLSADYLIRASAMVHGASNATTRVRRSLLGEIVRRLFGGQVSRAGFDYVKRMMLRDWQFRRRLLGLMPMMIGMLLGMFGSGLAAPFSQGFSAAHLIPHFLGFILYVVCILLPYGTDYKGVWLFLLVSDRALGRFAQGVHTSLWLAFIMVPNVVLFPLFAWRWGFATAGGFLLFSVAASSIYLTFGLRVIEGIPFGKQTQPGRDSAGQGGARMVILIFVTLAAAGIQYVLFRSVIAVAIAIVVLSAAAYFLTRWSLHSFEAAIRHHLSSTSQTSTMIYTEVESG